MNTIVFHLSTESSQRILSPSKTTMTLSSTPSPSIIELKTIKSFSHSDLVYRETQSSPSDFDSPQSITTTSEVTSKLLKREIDSPDGTLLYEQREGLDGLRFGVAKVVQERVRKFYSTTSSVYAEHTISNPNAEQLLFCMSTVIQSQIFEDISSSVERKALHPEFNFSPSLPPEYGGHLDFISRDVLQRESENDEELQRHLIAGNVPTVDTIYSYLSLLKEKSGYPTECNIIALIYTNRMTSMGSMPLTMQNWRAIWAVSVILAQKMWDDTPLKTSAFVQILPSFSKQLLRQLELNALTVLQFSTGVKPSLYAQYYFELRTLFFEIQGASPANTGWSLKPLSVIKARRLEDRSANVWDKSKSKVVSSRHDALSKSVHSVQSDGSNSSTNSPKISKERSTFLHITGSPASLSRSSPCTRSTPATSGVVRKGWQTSSPAQSNARDRLLMMDQHEESKGRNFNPYVFRERYHSLPEGPEQDSFASLSGKCSAPPKGIYSEEECNERDEFADTIVHSISDNDVDEVVSGSAEEKNTLESLVQFTSVSPPKAVTAERYVFWESIGDTRGSGERVVRTYEDVTLTDTSRYVIS